MRLFFLISFIIWGWAEMSTFIYIGSKFGGLATLLGIFITAMIGLSLLKRQGLSAMARIRSDLARGITPVGSIADSVALAAGGILMLIPGYVTDSIGLLLFLPGLRTFAGIWILNHIIHNNQFNGFINIDASHPDKQKPNPNDEHGDVIEGDVTERTQQKTNYIGPKY